MNIKVILLIWLLTIQSYANNDNKLNSIKKLSKTIQLIKNVYVEDLKFDKIINDLISGGISKLDPHSTFFDEKGLKEFKEMTMGEFGGLGFIVTKKKNVLTIISPIDNTPAYKAGIKPGDIILKINDKSALDYSLQDAVNIMRGKKGTKIQLTIYRKNITKPLVLNLVRDIIKVKSVKYKKYNDYLYIRISSFDNKVSSSILKILQKEKNIKGIVLDLRNNPGGLLSEAVNTSDIFLKKGKKIVISKGKLKNNNYTLYSEHEYKKYENIPLVVLINGGSASASEIVSGSLQDNKRAIIIGENSFGKGTIQQIFKLNDKEAIKLTIGKYYLPSGRTIQNKGIKPDIVIDFYKIKKEEYNFSLKEKDFKNSLKEKDFKNSLKEKINIKKDKKNNKTKLITNENLYRDNQLKTAFDTLTTINIITTNK